MDPQDAWLATLGQLQLQMNKGTYETWLHGTEVLAFHENRFTIGVRNAYAKDWLEQRLRPTIERALTDILDQPVEVGFTLWAPAALNEANDDPSQPSDPPARTNGTHGPSRSNGHAGDPEPTRAETQLNRRYRFETFVVGSSNRLAHAAALAVSEHPGRAYNPLFLYGGVGLGKTHLLQAIGNACQDQSLSVLYVTSEEFTNDLIHAIRTHTQQELRDKYRTIDVLLVDDVQFIAGKESTQEEFFHTFNALHGNDRQIVMTSDRPPRAMVTLEERLRSRFEWGMLADIQPPDFEMRLAILQAKAKQRSVEVPPEAMNLIAERVQTNIRELEGTLTRLVAYAQLTGQPITVEMVEGALADVAPRHHNLTPEKVVKTVAAHFGIDVERLTGRSRTRSVALPRQIAMFIARQETEASLPQIGQVLGGRDHTTVMHGCDKIATLVEQDELLRRQIVSIKEQLYQGLYG
ncbi:MAG: chromosomal replication initiator protein DnaA [Anaerolineae bacterium]|nr:chromosomal replication initiator protein DnaA [Anaerolineae bacterium]